MKKQICFAGFVESELAMLQPSLAALGAAWDCVVTPDASATMEALALAPFDAVVANLGPGGINDAELLRQAAIHYPRTARFALGDVADREMVVHCIGAVHQFISRPWKPSELVSIVERSLALDAWLATDQLHSFVPRLGKLPGLPSSYFEVIKRAESPNSTIESIAEVIARDPALTARLLQMVNSPACGLSQIVTSPAEAVSILGLETVKSLVLCLQLYGETSQVQGASFSLDELWDHSFRVAKLSARIVLRCINSERMASEAYTAGLLHNIGQIVLATNLAGEYAAVVETSRQRKRPLQEVEMEQMGVTSSQVGAYLLGLWGMPLPLVEAVALHLAPASVTMADFSLLTVVHVANVLAHESGGRSDGIPLPRLDASYLATLELPKKTDAWRKLLDSPPPAPVPVPRETVEEQPAPLPVERDVKPPSLGKLLLWLGLAVVVVAAVVLWKSFDFSALLPKKAAPGANSVPAPVATSPSPAAPANREKPPPAQGASTFDEIKIQAIIYNPTHPVVLINGKSLNVGDHINGLEVISIERSKVVLSGNGEQKTFGLK
ncbi:MAG: HDOD domain-containing protein [Limisphaerales bacterium]